MRIVKIDASKRMRQHRVMIALAVFLSIVILIILYTDEYEIPAKQNYEGTIELSSASSLDVSFTTMTVSGSLGLFTPTYLGNGFRWERDDLSKIQGLYLSSSEPGRIIRIWDSNGTLTEYIASDFRMDYYTMRNCSRLSVGNSDFKLSVSHRYARLRIENVHRGIQAIPLTFEALRGNEFLSMDFMVLERSEDSSISVTCDYPLFYIDSQSVQYNGTAHLNIKDFTSIEGSISLGEDSTVDVFGDLALQFTSARVIGEVVDGIISSPLGGYALEGRLVIINSTRFSMEIGRNELEWTDPPEPIRAGVLSEGGIAFTRESGQLTPASKTTIEWRLLDLDTSARDVLTVILSLCLGVLIYWLAEEGRDALAKKDSLLKRGSQRVPLRTRMMMFRWFEHQKKRRMLGLVATIATFFVVAILLLYILFNPIVFLIYGNTPMPYYYGEYDVDLNIHYEAGVDLELLGVTVTLFADRLERIMDTNVVDISWVSFPDDNVEYYDLGDSRIYHPVGDRDYNLAVAILTRTIEYNIIFKKGYGRGFAGLNNYGPVTVMPVQDFEDPILLLDILVHEFGHAIGLHHRTCSPLMTDSPGLSEPSLPSHVSVREGYVFRHVPLFDQAKSGTFDGFGDWGIEIARLMNRFTELEGLNTTMTKNIYVYFDEATGEIHEVVYWKSEDQSTGEISETAWVQRVPANAYVHSFSVGEYIYILEGLAGNSDAVRPLEHYC